MINLFKKKGLHSPRFVRSILDKSGFSTPTKGSSLRLASKFSQGDGRPCSGISSSKKCPSLNWPQISSKSPALPPKNSTPWPVSSSSPTSSAGPTCRRSKTFSSVSTSNKHSMLILVTISASDHSNVINNISATTIWPQKFSRTFSTHSLSTWKSTLPYNGLIPPTSSATWLPSAALGFWPHPSSGF